jgi:hypothetical protein
VGVTRQGQAGPGGAGRGEAGLGVARRGAARQGEARPGEARQGNQQEQYPSDEKGVSSTYTLGGSPEVVTVNAPGLYRLICASRKPEAERGEAGQDA